MRVLLTLTAVALVASAAVPAAAATTDIPPSPLTVRIGAPRGDGDIFITPTSAAGTGNGAQIVDESGRTVWFHRAAAGTVDADFRARTLHGKRVLTFWEGKGFGGLSDGTDYIYDDHYQQIAALHAGNGLTTDGHEFLLSDAGTAFVMSYERSTADLTALGGSDHQAVINGIIEEIDISTGQVLFSWNSADHVPYAQSEQPRPASPDSPWDWFHINAVHVDTDGKLLIDARNTWTAYKVDQGDAGRIVWQLGGKASTLRITAAKGQTLNDADRIFAWQHDINGLGGGVYTVFDNESAGVANTGQDATSQLDHSRVVKIVINERLNRARLVRADDEPDGLLAPSQGNGQTLADGDTFIGWGSLNALSEYDRHGKLIFDARYPTGVNSYRAYLLPWTGSSAA